MAELENELSEEMIEEEPVLPIGKKQIREASEILSKYKGGKSNLDNRIIEDEEWWKLRHWEYIRRKTTTEKGLSTVEPSSAWLHNSIINKHADCMDNFPEPVVLPREPSDETSAKVLTEILPVVMEYNNYEQTYSDNSYEKIKHGTGVYGVFGMLKNTMDLVI